MPADSIEAIVTDPPYGLGFMSKAWDALPPGLEWGEECRRVLKPGGFLLAFGGSRTYHRLAVAVEDAGLEIRDQLLWLYGAGFPKSHDVSKAIDKAAGAEREIVGKYRPPDADEWRLTQAAGEGEDHSPGSFTASGRRTLDVTAPATAEAKRWQGYGTALKPAHEPIVLARKPLEGTVAENVLRHGTGALNIDESRIPTSEEWEGRELPDAGDGATWGGALNRESSGSHELGRWPANLTLDPDAAELLDEQAPSLTAEVAGASRFFYCAKANAGERSAGLDLNRQNEGFRTRRCTSCRRNVPERGSCGCSAEIEWVSPKPTGNNHPTVKPIELMRWLVRLVTPQGGTVLDPFTGSGTTGIAAGLEAFDFVGVEREPEYAEIARARIKWWAGQTGTVEEILRRHGLAVAEQRRHDEIGQIGFDL
jgi:site-specific DNA-methyltransferase (adenine-specific)